MLYIDKDSKIRYNYPKLAAVHKVLELYQIQRIQEAQQQNLDNKDYKYRELTYVLKSIIKEFIKDFYKGLI